MEISNIAINELSGYAKVDKSLWPLLHCEYEVLSTYTDMTIPDPLDVQAGVLYKPGVKIIRDSIEYYNTASKFNDALTVTPGHLSTSDNIDFYLYGDEAIHIITNQTSNTLVELPSANHPIKARVLNYNDARQSVVEAITYSISYDQTSIDIVESLSGLSDIDTTITCYKVGNVNGFDTYMMQYFPVIPSGFSFVSITPSVYTVNFFSGIISIDENEATADTFTISGSAGVLISYYPHTVSSDVAHIVYPKDISQDNLVVLGAKQS